MEELQAALLGGDEGDGNGDHGLLAAAGPGGVVPFAELQLLGGVRLPSPAIRPPSHQGRVITAADATRALSPASAFGVNKDVGSGGGGPPTTPRSAVTAGRRSLVTAPAAPGRHSPLTSHHRASLQPPPPRLTATAAGDDATAASGGREHSSAGTGGTQTAASTSRARGGGVRTPLPASSPATSPASDSSSSSGSPSSPAGGGSGSSGVSSSSDSAGDDGSGSRSLTATPPPPPRLVLGPEASSAVAVTDDLHETVAVMAHAVASARHVIDSTLALERIDAGEFVVELRPTSIRTSLKVLFHSMAGLANKAGVTLRLQLPSADEAGSEC